MVVAIGIEAELVVGFAVGIGVVTEAEAGLLVATVALTGDAAVEGLESVQFSHHHRMCSAARHKRLEFVVVDDSREDRYH